jgi:hypothetical protein
LEYPTPWIWLISLLPFIFMIFAQGS